MERFKKFIAVGFLNTLIGFGLYSFFIFLNFKVEVSLSLSYLFGIIFNYFSTGIIVFQNVSFSPFLKFVLIYIFIYFLNLNILNFLIFNSLNKYLSQLICMIFVVPLTYILLKKIVYKN